MMKKQLMLSVADSGRSDKAVFVVKSLVMKYLEIRYVPVSWLTEFLKKIACMKVNVQNSRQSFNKIAAIHHLIHEMK